MPRIKETTVYTFEELSEKSKQKAIQDHYDINVSYEWWDFTYDDAATIGLKLDGFELQGSRIISGEFTHDAVRCAELILENHGDVCDTYKLAAEFMQKSTIISVKYKLLNEEDNDNELSEIYEIENEFKKDILNTYWKILDEEYDYLTSEEAIKETLISNEYEFNEDGTIN